MIWRNNKKKAGSTKKIEALKEENEKLKEQIAVKKQLRQARSQNEVF